MRVILEKVKKKKMKKATKEKTYGSSTMKLQAGRENI
jgi:hypothetical protein